MFAGNIPYGSGWARGLFTEQGYGFRVCGTDPTPLMGSLVRKRPVLCSYILAWKSWSFELES